MMSTIAFLAMVVWLAATLEKRKIAREQRAAQEAKVKREAEREDALEQLAKALEEAARDGLIRNVRIRIKLP